MTAANYCPEGYYLPAIGQTLPIVNNQALYAVLGNTYGGDRKTNFRLPDLRDRAPAENIRFCIAVNGVFPVRP
ncbi:MAG: phage tail protein [Pseudomonadota bacterium]